MIKRISIFFTIITSLIYTQGRGLPSFIYGPSTISYSQDGDSTTTIKKLKMGKRLSDDVYIASCEEKSFILICEEIIISLEPNSKILLDRSDKFLRIVEGNVIIHHDGELNNFCYDIIMENGAIGYIGPDKIKLRIDYKDQSISNGVFYPKTNYELIDKSFIKEAQRDGKYILSLIYQYDLPSLQKKFNLPSKRNHKFKFSTREKTGTASYNSNTYYHAGSYLKLRKYEFEFVYNLYIAISPTEGFYSENWDEWQDIINNIGYLQFYHPTDPFYFRIGMIEKLEFGRGYLVDNYNNSIILPFENLSGVQVKIGNRNFLSNFFVNDILKPRVAGAYFNKRITKRIYTDITYVGDFNQYSNILDSDNDSYPDKVDPEPDIKNSNVDSIIIAEDPISLDNIKKSQLHAIGFGLKFQIGNISASDIYITGDIGMLSTPGIGISFPNLFIGNSTFGFGVGADFQSPNFINSVFDRSYEYKKARFVKNDDEKYKLISRAQAIDDQEGDWYNGWNTFFNLTLAKRLRLTTRYRQIHRQDDVKKHITVSLKSKYSFTNYLRSYSFFIDHKDIDKILKDKTDGQIYGFQISLQPHSAVDVDVRYRQQYRDKDGNGTIGDDDVIRNFGLNVILDTDYWWKKYKNRKKI